MKKSRKEALLAKELTYNTKKPCKHGHLSDRRTDDGSCIECRRAQSKGVRDNVRLMLKG